MTYWAPRRRRGAPAVVVGVVGLLSLVGAQLGVAGTGGPGTPGPPTAVARGPEALPSPAPVPAQSAAQSPAGAPEAPAAGPPVPEVAAVPFEVGAVVDEAAGAAVEQLAEALRRPGSAPVVLEGVATGPDEAAAVALAEERAAVVLGLLLDRGVPPGTVTTGARAGEDVRGVLVLPAG